MGPANPSKVADGTQSMKPFTEGTKIRRAALAADRHKTGLAVFRSIWFGPVHPRGRPRALGRRWRGHHSPCAVAMLRPPLHAGQWGETTGTDMGGMLGFNASVHKA